MLELKSAFLGIGQASLGSDVKNEALVHNACNLNLRIAGYT